MKLVITEKPWRPDFSYFCLAFGLIIWFKSCNREAGSRSCKITQICSAIRGSNHIPKAVTPGHFLLKPLLDQGIETTQKQSPLLILLSGDGKTCLSQILTLSRFKVVSANVTAFFLTRAVMKHRSGLRRPPAIGFTGSGIVYLSEKFFFPEQIGNILLENVH